MNTQQEPALRVGTEHESAKQKRRPTNEEELPEFDDAWSSMNNDCIR